MKLALGCLFVSALAAPGCMAPTAPSRPLPSPLVLEGEGQEADEPLPPARKQFDRRNRLSVFGSSREEDGDTDFALGGEFAIRIRPQWSVGALVDYVDAKDDEYLVAGSLIFHPIYQVGLSLHPGVQVRDGDDESLALRAGMSYDFHLSAGLSIGPVFYIDLLESGDRSSSLGIAVRMHF